AYLCPPHSHLSSLPSSHNPTPRSLPSTLSLHDALPICAGRRRAGSSCSTWRRRAQRGSRRTQLPRAGAARAGSCWTSWWVDPPRSEEHTSELQSRFDLVCRLLLEKKNVRKKTIQILGS